MAVAASAYVQEHLHHQIKTKRTTDPTNHPSSSFVRSINKKNDLSLLESTVGAAAAKATAAKTSEST